MAYENQFKDGWGKSIYFAEKAHWKFTLCQTAKKLEKALFVTDAKSILEIGCGDLVWHGKNLPDIDYYGIDLHERDTWEARREQGAKLSVNDAADPGLPNADLIVARDVFIHLSNDYIIKILENLKTWGNGFSFHTTQTQMAPEEAEKTRLFSNEPMESIWLNNLSI